MFRSLGHNKEEFVNLIGKSVYTYEEYKTITDDLAKKLFVHYFTISGLLKAINSELAEKKHTILDILNECPILYTRMIRHISEKKVSNSSLVPMLRFGKKTFVKDILKATDVWNTEKAFVLDNLEKAQLKSGIQIFDFALLKYLQLFDQIGVIDKKDKRLLSEYVDNLSENDLRSYLLSKIGKFKDKVLEGSANEAAAQYLVREIEESIGKLYRQLSLFEGDFNED